MATQLLKSFHKSSNFSRNIFSSFGNNKSSGGALPEPPSKTTNELMNKIKKIAYMQNVGSNNYISNRYKELKKNANGSMICNIYHTATKESNRNVNGIKTGVIKKLPFTRIISNQFNLAAMKANIIPKYI